MNKIKFSLIKFLYEIKSVVLILVLLIAKGCAAVETANEPPPAVAAPPEASSGQKFNPSMAIVLACLLISFLFICSFFYYFHHYTERQLALAATTGYGGERSSVKLAAACGLDPSVIASFTSFTYSTVKEIKIGQQALECAVCLNEFRDHENLRLLPECCHVFHRDCIDQWLALHVTCPVCRVSLVPKPSQLDEKTESSCGSSEPTKGHVSIQVTDMKHDLPPARKISRAHSMGHLVVERPVENIERYTLRLPEEMQNVLRNSITDPSTSPYVAFPMESSMKMSLRSASVNSIRGSDYFNNERFDHERQSGGQRLIRVTRSFISCDGDDSVMTSVSSSLNHLFSKSSKDLDIVKRLNDS